MDDKLKPCPFCGGGARYVPDHTTEGCDYLYCTSCNASVEDRDRQGDCVDTWNTRATLPDRWQDDDDPECLTIAYMQGVADGRGDRWQPIETAPTEDHETFLVFDGIGVWKAWRLNGEIVGYEVDGAELPSDDYPPTHWMPQPAPPQEADT